MNYLEERKLEWTLDPLSPILIKESKNTSCVSKFFKKVIDQKTTHLKFKEGTPPDVMKGVIAHCKNLQSLDLGKNPSLVNYFFAALKTKEINASNLRTLNVAESDLKELYLIGLENLNDLNISYSNEIRDFFPLISLKNLKNLNISSCGFEQHGVLNKLTQLKCLSLSVCYADINVLLDGLSQLEELDLSFYSFQQKNDISILENFTKLKKLNLISSRILNSSPIKNLNQLKSLDISANYYISSLDFLSDLNELEYLNVSKCSFIKDFDPLKNLTNLRSLELMACGIRNISLLKDCNKLEKLDLRHCFIKDLPELSNFSQLKILNLSDNKHSLFLNFLSNSIQLRKLYLSGCLFDNIDDLQKCRELETLDLNSCWSLMNISVVEYLINLKDLNLKNCKSIEDFSNLSACKKLQKLNLEGCRVFDYSFLRDLNHLQILITPKGRTLQGEKILEFIENPTFNIPLQPFSNF